MLTMHRGNKPCSMGTAGTSVPPKTVRQSKSSNLLSKNTIDAFRDLALGDLASN